jgi:small subunit ribosomal protein S14
MKYFIPKDKRHRKAASLLEWNRFLYKAIVNNSFLPKETRLAAWQRLAHAKKFGQFTLIRNRCITSGRGRSVNRVFRLGRSMFHIMSGARLTSWCQTLKLVNSQKYINIINT